ncbi:MAG: RNA polymerase sigma factor [Candidatus Ozemobacteraceae bacterium]
MDIVEIMELFRRNPREGFRRLYGEVAPRLKAYLIRGFSMDEQEAEDLIHDAFLPWVETPQAMGDVANPVSYLFTSVRNGALRNRRRPPTVPCDEELPSTTTGVDTAVKLDIQVALARLPEDQRDAVVMRIWGDVSLAEAAEQQGVPVQTLASRYRYGLARLKEIFQWPE